MLEFFKTIGFLLLFFRFVFWVSNSFAVRHVGRVLVAQAAEGMLLLFFFSQLFGNVKILPMNSQIAEVSGFLLVCIGVGIAFLAKKQLGREWVYAAVYSQSPKKQLVTTGLYKYIRHPLYTGIFLSYLGAELLAGSWLWISMLFLMIPFYFQAKKEEKGLQKHFGEKYRKYQKQTKMYVPGIL